LLPCAKAFCGTLKKAIGEDNVGLLIAEGKPHYGGPSFNEAGLSTMCLDFLDMAMSHV
jgi:hypothetical protein